MQRCTCQALLQQEHLQVDALELTPAAERPAGHTSGSATPPSAGCMDNVSTTALLVGTATHQESLLSACVSGRQRCTTPLLPRAVWGTSTSGQPGAGMPSQGRVPGSLLRSLPVTLVTAPPGRGGQRIRSGGGRRCSLQGFKGEQLVAVKSIPGWAAWHSPPRWQPEWSASPGSPSRQQLRAE